MRFETLKRLMTAACYHQGTIGNGHRIVGGTEIVQARTEFDALVDENAELRKDNQQLLDDAKPALAKCVETEDELDAVRTDRDRLRKEVERMRPVVEAAMSMPHLFGRCCGNTMNKNCVYCRFDFERNQYELAEAMEKEEGGK